MESSWTRVSARRMARHGLAGAPRPDVVSAVAAMCGAHAQVMSAAETSIGLRVADTTRADVRAALWTGRSLVKTFGPRGTVHLLPAADLPLWTAALGAVPAGGSLAAAARLTADQLDAVVAAIGAALDGAELTVPELHDAVVAATGPWAADEVMPAFGGFWPRWRQAIEVAAHRGVLCYGAGRGRGSTYTSPRRWLTGSRWTATDALAELVRRYLHAYGPAAPEHFAQWLAAPQAWAAGLFADADLRPVSVAGQQLWELPAEQHDDPDPAPLLLLPYFDPYVVAGQPRSLLFPGAAATRARSGTGQAGTFPVLLVRGEVAGVWHLRRSGRRLHVTVEPLRPLSARLRRELDTQVERIAAVQQGTATLTIGEVTAGSHA